jgi:hypothetical protein
MKMRPVSKKIFSAFLLNSVITSCGPVPTRLLKPEYVEKAESRLSQAQVSRQQNRYLWDDQNKKCQNALGLQGYNGIQDEGFGGPCSIFTDAKQLAAIREGSVQGSLFLGITLPEKTALKNLNLNFTQWVRVKGKRIQLHGSTWSGAKFTESSITDQNGKEID